MWIHVSPVHNHRYMYRPAALSSAPPTLLWCCSVTVLYTPQQRGRRIQHRLDALAHATLVASIMTDVHPAAAVATEPSAPPPPPPPPPASSTVAAPLPQSSSPSSAPPSPSSPSSSDPPLPPFSSALFDVLSPALDPAIPPSPPYSLHRTHWPRRSMPSLPSCPRVNPCVMLHSSLPTLRSCSLRSVG